METGMKLLKLIEKSAASGIIFKRLELRQSTYEGYACRIQSIKEYFQKDNPELIALTPKHFNDFFHYALEYGKVNQKTHKREPLAVRTVRSYRSILHAVYKEAIINGMIEINPLDNVTVRGKKNHEYKCLRLEGSNFRLGGIAPITWAVPSFRVSMRPAVSVAWQKGN